jgi:hypothetical protein
MAMAIGFSNVENVYAEGRIASDLESKRPPTRRGLDTRAAGPA